MPQCPQYKFLTDNHMVYCQLEDGHEGPCLWPITSEDIGERWAAQQNCDQEGHKEQYLNCPVCGRPVRVLPEYFVREVASLPSDLDGTQKLNKPGRLLFVHRDCYPLFVEWWKKHG